LKSQKIWKKRGILSKMKIKRRKLLDFRSFERKNGFLGRSLLRKENNLRDRYKERAKNSKNLRRYTTSIRKGALNFQRRKE